MNLAMNTAVAEEEFFDVSEMGMESDASPPLHTDREPLEKVGHWLLSIPRDNFVALRDTPEYGDFLKAFDKLGQAHRRVLAMVDTELDKSVPDEFSFLQHMAVDDVVLRVFEVLDCEALVRTSATCSRFRELAHRSGTQRTYHISKSRQLDHVMKLLRAKEEIDGSSSVGSIIHDMNSSHVPVPILGLEKRVIVTDASDSDFNGVYYCTGCDANGFVFTKPRNREARATSIYSTPLQDMDDLGMLDQLMQSNWQQDSRQHSGNKEVPTEPGELLRCSIAKRYSETTLLWYMSKEVEEVNSESGNPQITNVYPYWSTLSAAVPTELSGYPSQTSVMTSAGETAWQGLLESSLTAGPTVEVLD